ncbi:MAG: glycosyltransferase family 2 protein [Planctomycetes bacterium]|nr:glycosyltransferase family 2 protein [Planctomycetota bacterium]
MSPDPNVAIVIPNFNGKHHIDPCMASLDAVDYPKEQLRVVFVDNGSVDGSIEHLRSRFPRVQVQENGENLGFSAACNLGARLASNCKILIFLNNDMRVEPSFVRELIAPILEGNAACSAARILSWDGKSVDYAGSAMAFHGIGRQSGHGDDAGSKLTNTPGPTLFACGGAMAIEREVFEDAGGFDEDFFAYYEDADFGWRLWVLGHQVLYIPSAVCYHHHSATAKTFPQERIRLLQVRNPILTILKNYGDEHVEGVLAAALLLAIRRGIDVGGIDIDSFRIERTKSRPTGGVREVLVRAQRRLERKISIPRNSIADFVAIADVGELLPKILAKRRTIQKRRKRGDEAIFPLFRDPFWIVEPGGAYQQLQRTVEEFFHLRAIFGEPRSGSSSAAPKPLS